MIIHEDKEKRRREMLNALAQMSNTLHAIQHKPITWENRIKYMQTLSKMIPPIIRYMIYFQNVDKP